MEFSGVLSSRSAPELAAAFPAKVMTREAAAGHTEYTLAEGCNDCFGESQFLDAIVVHACGPRHGIAIFERGSGTALGKGAGTATGAGPPEGFARLARHFNIYRWVPEPLHALQQTAPYFPVGRTQVQRYSDDGIGNT